VSDPDAHVRVKRGNGPDLRLAAKSVDTVGAAAVAATTSSQGGGVTKRCRLFWLTNSTLVYDPKCGGGGGGVAGSQPMSTALHMSPTPYLTYASSHRLSLSPAGANSGNYL
jgi:hypothetical protein